MEKFKEGFAGGRNFVVEEPKFDFKKPVFKKSLDLPRASEVPIATKYLEKRKIDPSKFYFTKEFQKWTNTHKQTFDTIHRDESRVIIPLHDTEKNLIGFQGRSLGPNSVKYITVMLNEDAPKIYGLDKIDEKNLSTSPKDHSTRPLWKTRLLCAVPILILGRLVGAVIFGFLITNLVTEKSLKESTRPLDRGDQVIIWPKQIVEKDVNDMALAGHDIMSILESNTYSGLKAKVKFNTWKKV